MMAWNEANFWPEKYVLYGQFKIFSWGTKQAISSGQDAVHLSRSFSQSDHTIRLHTEFKVAWLAEE